MPFEMQMIPQFKIIIITIQFSVVNLKALVKHKLHNLLKKPAYEYRRIRRAIEKNDSKEHSQHQSQYPE